MRRSIIILVLLLLAVPAFGQTLPARYYCKADDAIPEEAEFCGKMRIAFESTGFVELDVDGSRPHFRIVVLPTVRDGYYSITVASGFVYPPLNGLVLSAYLSGYLLQPGGMTDENIQYIAQTSLRGIFSWMAESGDAIIKIGKPDATVLEAVGSK